MRDLLDAVDELVVGISLVDLISMTTRKNPDDDEKAISAGCQAVLDRLASCLEIFRAVAAGQHGRTGMPCAVKEVRT